ncbi:MAG: DUF4418 family protein [Bacillota bacterium]|nr:DUF4418 family protein [Bacillota bacterium]
MKNKSITGMIIIVLGVLVALIPKVIFPVCTNRIELMNGKTLFMKCHWTAMTELMIGTLIVFNGILLIVFKKHETRIALSIMLFLLGLAALLIPTAVIGMCETATMACRVGTEPALIVVSVITMALGIGNIYFQSNCIKSEQIWKERSVIK